MAKFLLKDILWGATLKVNLVRVIVAGIIWTIIAYAMGMETPSGMPGLWLYMFIWPIGYFIFLPIAMVAGWLSNAGVPFAGLITFIPAIMVIPADPIIFFIHKANKNFVPVENYKFIEPAFSIWVYENMISVSEANASDIKADKNPESSTCHFKGRILVDKDTKVLGLNWPSKSTAFIINDDWSVETEHDRSFGWIDINGEIHKGLPFGEIDPKATLSGGSTGIKIIGDSVWVKNEKIGDRVQW